MGGDPEQPRMAADSADVPQHFAEALDRSADDLRQGRTEDARAGLARLQQRLGGHLAHKRPAAPKG